MSRRGDRGKEYIDPINSNVKGRGKEGQKI